MRRRLFIQSSSAATVLALTGCGGGGGSEVAGNAGDAPTTTALAASPTSQVASRTSQVASATPGSWPSRILACYFTTWDSTYNITQVPLDFNVIYVFNAQPQGPVLADGTRNNTGDGTFWLPDMGAAQISKDSIQQVRARGQKVLLSVGGAGCGYNFTTRTKSQNFVNSFKSMYTSLGGVDGIDFNNFEANIGSTPSEMIWIAQQLRALYGAEFGITAPPSAFSTGGAPINGIAASGGADLNTMGAMKDAGVLTYAGPQYYAWSFYKGAGVVSAITDQWVARLGEDHVVVGLTAEGDFANGLTLAECQRELTTILAAHPNIKGIFCWSAQSNIGGGNRWGSAMKPLILG